MLFLSGGSLFLRYNLLFLGHDPFLLRHGLLFFKHRLLFFSHYLPFLSSSLFFLRHDLLFLRHSLLLLKHGLLFLRHSLLFLKHGFLYDSSMMGNDFSPYYARQGDVIALDQPARHGRQTSLVEMPIHWSTDDSPHFEFVRTEATVRQGLMNAGAVLDNWVNDFLYMKDSVEWGVLTYTCHPFVIGRGHRMLMLERLIKTCADNSAVFMTMEEAVAEFKSRKA